MKFKKILLLSLILGAFLISPSFAAWDPAVPATDDPRSLWPSQAQANWAAIALGTDPALLITNAKISPTAAIVDTKLAQIATAGKVSGAALVLLGNIPSGAGQVPIANGGTGQSTATAAATALLPSQTGNSGKALITNATVQSWGYPASLTVASAAIGDLLYYNSTAWVRLAAGASGYFLKAQGASAPVWAKVNLASSDEVTGNLPVTNLNSGTSASASTYWRGDGSWAALDTTHVQIFTSNGTFTVPAGVSRVRLTLLGGGGGGGSGNSGTGKGGGGGGGGAVIENFWYPVTAGSGISVIVGAGGAAGVGPTGAGEAGGASSFNTIISVTAGAAGAAGSEAGAGGAGGVGVNTTTVPACASTTGSQLDESSYSGGNGAPCQSTSGGGGGRPRILGYGGNGGAPAAVGSAGGGYGGGGGGGGCISSSNGGVGAGGIVIVEW